MRGRHEFDLGGGGTESCVIGGGRLGWRNVMVTSLDLWEDSTRNQCTFERKGIGVGPGKEWRMAYDGNGGFWQGNLIVTKQG